MRRVLTAAVAAWAWAGLAAAQGAPPANDMPGMAMGAVPAAAGPPETLDGWARGAQLLPGLGGFHRQASHASPAAQAYFDQGMRLIWAFNHDEATRAFAKAAALSPDCAACWWGVALSLGPNYNLPLMSDPRGRVGWEAVQRARATATGATPAEQALIAAVAERFVGPAGLAPDAATPRLVAYARAMEAAADRFPDDLDVQVLTAEAEMNVHPWQLWTKDGAPAPGTETLVARLEGVLAKAPNHPGANHYYVHAVEASGRPERGLAAAERLPLLMPGAGHIVHMPAHILQRVGRYEDAAEANRRASLADAAYYQITPAIDYYPMYSAHNYQFLAASAAMEGRRAETLAALRQVRSLMPDAMLAAMPGTDWAAGAQYLAMVRFGLWNEILGEPEPPASVRGLHAAWLAARGAALAAHGRVDEAQACAATLETLASTAPADQMAGLNSARDVLAVTALTTRARVALAKGETQRAASLLREAVTREDALNYDEPADIFIPSRHLLGAVLLDAGDAPAAEAVYREDLRRNPDNGWAFTGLAKALAAEGRAVDAEQARVRSRRAFARADVEPPGSIY